MARAIDIQFLGSSAVLGVFAAAEGAVRVLDAYPASPLAWYLNLHVFGVFEAARMDGSALRPLFHPAALEITLVLMVGLAAMRLLRLRFGLALAANLGFVATLFLADAVRRAGAAHARSVSLDTVAVAPPADTLALVVLLLASFAACLASHVSFIRAVTGERRGRSGAGRSLA